jgi:hypothetical protein
MRNAAIGTIRNFRKWKYAHKNALDAFIPPAQGPNGFVAGLIASACLMIRMPH